jgi:xylulokinase
MTGRTVETVEAPQNVGAVGAAAVIGVGLRLIDGLERVRDFIPAVKTFRPDTSAKAAYDKNFTVFKSLYRANKKLFKIMNQN